jgi:hypothetical protein
MGKPKTADKPAAPASARANAAQPDERDAKIARLERTVAEERQNAAELREANDALKFKLQILEKGYSKQLADARKKMDAAVQDLAVHQARLAELGTGGEDTQRLLAEARAELNRLKADQSLLKEQLARGGSRASARSRTGDDGSDTSSTINALIMSVPKAPERAREPAADPSSSQRARAEESAAVEMLSPDLMFTKTDKDD